MDEKGYREFCEAHLYRVAPPLWVKGQPFTVEAIRILERENRGIAFSRRIQEAAGLKGFGVQITPAGKFTLSMQYKRGDERKFIKLSSAIEPNKWSDDFLSGWLAEGRVAAGDIRMMIDSGRDPQDREPEAQWQTACGALAREVFALKERVEQLEEDLAEKG